MLQLIDGKNMAVYVARTNMANAKLNLISDKTSRRHQSVGEKKKIQDKIASTVERDSRYINRELLSKHELVVQLFTRTRGVEQWAFNKERIVNAKLSNLYRQTAATELESSLPATSSSFIQAFKSELIGNGVGPPKIMRELIAAQPQLINVQARDLEIGYQIDTQGPIITLKNLFKVKAGGNGKGRLFTLAREQQLFDRVRVPAKMTFASKTLWSDTKENSLNRRSKLMLLAIESFVLQQLLMDHNDASRRRRRDITVVADGSLFHKLENGVSYASAGIAFLADTRHHGVLPSTSSLNTRNVVVDLSQPQQHHQLLNQTLLVSIVPHFDWISSPLEAELASISAANLFSILIQQCYDHHRLLLSSSETTNNDLLSWQCWSDSKSAVRSWRKEAAEETIDEEVKVPNASPVSELVAAIVNSPSSAIMSLKWGAGHPESISQDFSRWSTYDWLSWYADRLSNLAADSIVVKSDTTEEGLNNNQDDMSGMGALSKQIEAKTSCKLKDKAVAISMTELLTFFTTKEN